MPQRIKPENKKHIRCLFVTKLKTTKSLYDFALLTDDFQFYQCEIRTVYKDITTDLWLKLRHTFLPFQFDRKTDVIVTSNISVYEPIAFYLKILQEQLHFRMKFVDLNRIPQRIVALTPYYMKHKKRKDITVRDIRVLWPKIVASGKCPWITEEIDQILKESYAAYARRMKYLRLGMYYMIVKQHLFLNSLRSGLKRLQQMSEEQKQINEYQEQQSQLSNMV